MNTESQPRRAGRPPKAAEDRRSAMMRLRVREELRDSLEQAASVSKRTLTDETEIRLRNSFLFSDLHEVLVSGGKPSVDLVLNIVSLLKTVQAYQDADGAKLGDANWLNSNYTRAALRRGLLELVEHSIPPALSPEEMPLKPDAKVQYAANVAFMEGLGAETAQALTGQRPNLAESLDRGGEAEH